MRIIVIGAGKVGYTLAEHLIAEEHDVIIIDKDDDVIQRCSGSLDALCIRGNGANAKILLEAGVDKSNIVIASTESDESNMLACLISKRLGADYTIARIRDPEFNESQTLLQNELGIDVAINPERATALEISRLLTTMNVYISDMKAQTTADGVATMLVTFVVSDADQLNHIMSNLRKLKSVIEVRRVNGR